MSRTPGSPSVNFKYVDVACLTCGQVFTRKAIANRSKWCPAVCAPIRNRERRQQENRRAGQRRRERARAAA